MASYRVELLPTAIRDLQSVNDRRDRRRIADAASRLAFVPRPVGCAKLRGPLALFRIRIGNYRVIYAINDAARAVTIQRIGDRKDIYR